MTELPVAGSDRDFGAERRREIDLAAHARRNRNAVVRCQIAASDVGRRMRLDIDGHLCAGGNAGEAIGWNREPGTTPSCGRRPEHVGLLDERLLPGGLNARIAEGGENLSGGQRMRIGMARILLSDGVVIADEPTAKLDPQTAKLVRQVLTEVAERRLVIVATHDEQLIEAASRHHVLQLNLKPSRRLPHEHTINRPLDRRSGTSAASVRARHRGEWPSCWPSRLQPPASCSPAYPPGSSARLRWRAWDRPPSPSIFIRRQPLCGCSR